MEWFSQAALEHLLSEYGYGLVFLIIMLEAMGVPAPGESLMIAAGVYAATTGRLEIGWVITASICGAILGDNFGYLIGRWAGFPLLKRYGSRVGLTDRRLTLGRYLFMRQGGKVVFAGRFIAILRTFVALLAGANHMDWKVFLMWNAVGGVVWASLYGGGAYLAGNLVTKIAGPIAMGLGIVAAIGVVIAIVLLRRNETRLEERAEQAMREQDNGRSTRA